MRFAVGFVAAALVAALLVSATAGAREPGEREGRTMAAPEGYDFKVLTCTLLGNGHVRCTGTVRAPAGEDWGFGFEISNEQDSRTAGQARLSAPVVPFICDGTDQPWEAESNRIYNGGITTPGPKHWSGKLQSPSVGTWTKKYPFGPGTVEAA